MKRKATPLDHQRQDGKAVLSVLVRQQVEEQNLHRKYIMTFEPKNMVDAKNIVEELRVLVTYLEQARRGDAEHAKEMYEREKAHLDALLDLRGRVEKLEKTLASRQ
nr:hypothetical protein [uncultured Nitrososphaera sp.]